LQRCGAVGYGFKHASTDAKSTDLTLGRCRITGDDVSLSVTISA